MRNLSVFALCCLYIHLGISDSSGQSVDRTQESSITRAPEDRRVQKKQNFNLPLKTGGGIQVWTDRTWREGYRIQQNSITGHFRLLDANDVRQAWGTRAQCQQELDSLQQAPVAGQRRHFVLLLHGLMRTSGSMKTLENRLAEHGYRDVIRFSYASTRGSIAEHADALRELVEQLPTDATFRFVGHSMGNIVTRHAIGDWIREDPQRVLPRCRSMVMLGPPNQGAAIAPTTGAHQSVRMGDRQRRP